MKRTVVEVNKHRIELSNLEKVLFPDEGIIKAEVIEYYLKVAPTMLRHIKGRPLSLVRYPDGITGEVFFQKQRPDWTPEWIVRKRLGDDTKTEYLLASREADLVWMANLASIELHQTNGRTPRFEKPDYMAFDLDPPENFEFKRTVEIALQLKEHLEGHSYHPFAKTSGGKGIHLFVPIEPKVGYEEVARAAQDLARQFVDRNRQTTTLQMKKESRKGRLLVDIWRNAHHQTTVCPYSVRGRPGAPVSMPLAWEQIATLKDPREYNIRTVLDHLRSDGDAWEGMGAYAVRLHTRDEHPNGSASAATVERDLNDYARKRSFKRTPEPVPEAVSGNGSSFVLHRHHATRLHYDLRLEQNGVLKSWAVPKGLPPRPGVKRLAVATEDHPLTYLNFEGTIPHGEYGAGPMWVFATGKHEVTKQKKDSFHFLLHSRPVTSEFLLIHTRGNEWLLERADGLQVDWLHDPVKPMLAQVRERPFDDSRYLYEIKWDGIRALVAVEDGRITIRSRGGRDITTHFPELQEEGFRANCGLFDAEIVCLDSEGKPVFSDVIARLQQSGANAIAHARGRHPATCYVFDCLYLDGCTLINEPLERRRTWLADSIRPDTSYRLSEAIDDGVLLFETAVGMGLEGVMAKRRDSLYVPGKRSHDWLKIKAHRTVDAVIIGYTAGKGGRESHFGALHLGLFREGRLSYLGKVGTGFDDRQLELVLKELRQSSKTRKPVTVSLADEGQTIWIEPSHVCEVRYSSMTRDGILREPIFLRMRPDLAPEDTQDPRP